jgi:hypothetical protein
VAAGLVGISVEYRNQYLFDISINKKVGLNTTQLFY